MSSDVISDSPATDAPADTAGSARGDADAAADAAVVTEELLVEEVSIDGMCGVY